MIEIGGMANSSGDDSGESNEDDLDGIFTLFNDDLNDNNGDDVDGPCGLFNDDVNYRSTCNLQPLEPNVSTVVDLEDTHCCSSAISSILKCCTSLSNIDIGCHRNLRNFFPDMKQIYKRYYLIIRMAITSLIVCSVDMVSDVLVSIAHFERCDWWWGTASALLVILPMSWIAYTLIKNEMWKHEDFNEKKMKVFLVICAILQVLVIYWFIWKARKWWSMIKVKKGNNENLPRKILEKDIFLFKKVKAKEGLLEGGLQLSLQSYILLKKIKNVMDVKGCQSSCKNGRFTLVSSYNSFQNETCIDYIQIGGIILSLFALSYSQAFMFHRHKKWRQLTKFFIYIQIISIRMFIPAVLAVFDNKCKWYLAPGASLLCYSTLYYTRRFLTKKEFNLPKVLQWPHEKREKVLARSIKDVLYWGLNHMLFNVTSVSGLAISFSYMICSLPYVIIEDDLMYSKYFYFAATGLSIMCVIVNIVFVICFRDFGKKIIPLSSDP